MKGARLWANDDGAGDDDEQTIIGWARMRKEIALTNIQLTQNSNTLAERTDKTHRGTLHTTGALGRDALNSSLGRDACSHSFV